MAVLSFRISTYARSIYIYGTETLSNIQAEYVEPVKQYAGTHYTKEQIDNTLAQGWITEQEYSETLIYNTPIVTQ